jgi:signal peptidase I
MADMTTKTNNLEKSLIDGAKSSTLVNARVAEGKNQSGESKPDSQANAFVARETIESFAVALILAFMFRAFVAEIFVIPTGSMAPTLMGAHKDVESSETGFQYQSGASFEFVAESGAKTGITSVGTTCPLSRRTEILDLAKNANHTTFSGDRIIVSKFSYVWSDPKRWDVIVFKYPYNARINYIKRCVGLPNETLRIEQGDIYVRPEGQNEFAIARKPPHVVEATLQPVADTDYIAQSAVKAGVPSAWQPHPTPGAGNLGWDINKADQEFSNGWTVTNEPTKWEAEFKPNGDASSPAWLRYHHRVLSRTQWASIEKSGKLPAPVPRYSSRLISDFTAYNFDTSRDRSRTYDESGRIDGSYVKKWNPAEPNEEGFYNFHERQSGSLPFENDGRFWTGDLASEFDVKIGQGEGKLVLDLVEAGRHYLCEINLQDGKAFLNASENGAKLSVFEAENNTTVDTATASTSVTSGSRHRIKFSNVNNTLMLWVDGKIAEFSPSNRIVSDDEAMLEKRFPTATAEDPFDSAPVAIGVSGVSLNIRRARVWRDIYYIASFSQGNDNPSREAFYSSGEASHRLASQSNQMDDANLRGRFSQSVTSELVADYCARYYPNEDPLKLSPKLWLQRDLLYSTPSLWQKSPVFMSRRFVEINIGDEEYFPMGDNSAASADGRSWAKPLPRDLMIGKAVSVFWPHFWMSPIPYFPNFERMGLIR